MKDVKGFSGVKVFSASMWQDRERLGEKVTAWIEERGDTIDLVEIVVRQSSDSSFHLVSIVVFYNQVGHARIDHAIKAPSSTAQPDKPNATRRLTFREGKLEV